MTGEDSFRWNERYSHTSQDAFDQFRSPRTFLIESRKFLPGKGLALDVAMGMGGNASFLQSTGLKVIGVDLSNIAVRQAKADHPELDVFIADLTEYPFPTATFEVIANFYYLNRPLWVEYPRMLKPGGTLLIETLTVEMLTIKPEIEPAYLLEPGELAGFFPDLEVLFYREGWTANRSGSQKAVASLIARKTR